ncbi:MAG: lipocalin family protein [Mycobacterium sp.]
MTSTRWAIWLGTFGAGACIALGAGHGVAAADTDSSDSGGSTSRSTGQDSSQTSRDSSAKGDDADSTTDASKDPASAPSSKRSDKAAEQSESESPTSRTESDRTQREADEAETDDSDDSDDTASSDAETATTTKRSAVSEPVSATTEPAVAPETSSPQESSAETATVVTEPVPDVVEPTPVETTVVAPAAATVKTAASASATVAAAQTAVQSVTGVQTGRAQLTIPVGPDGYTTRADWYLPTQADGSVAATGVIWLQHGFFGNKLFVSALARTLSQQTNSIIVAPNLPSFAPWSCAACQINSVEMQQAVASMFLGDRTSLNTSATAAGLLSSLPGSFILSGQSAGGGLATAAGGFYNADPLNEGDLRGVVMFDGVSRLGLTGALQSLDDPFIPVYQIAAPPQPGNASGVTTTELVAARPGQFVGVTLARGSHADSLIGANPLVDFFSQLATRFSPPGNTQAVYTLATGWINDLYQGLGPADGNGIYGAPSDYIVMGETAAVVLGPPPVVDLGSYLGTWYEVGSVKQFFSIGLVNTTAVYSLNPDGSIKVENSGNYFFNDGPQSTITGVALPVDTSNNKLNVRFFGAASANPPGNYWIVDLDPDYQWAVVSDSTGLSGFLLSRTRVVSDDLYQELLDRASVSGVRGWITRTRQPAATADTATV